MEQKRIDISTGIIFRTIAILILLWLLYLILDILAILFISVIIVSAIDPAVDWFQKKKIPRSAGVLVIYLVIFIVLAIAVYFVVPPVVSQAQDLAKQFPDYYQKSIGALGPVQSFLDANQLDRTKILGNVSDSLSNISRNIFSTTVGVFSGLISAVVVISLTFYMSAEQDAIRKFVISVTPKSHQEYAAKLTERIKNKIGKWLIGQLALMIIVGFLTFLGLFIIGIPNALILGILAGILEIVPYIGPLISAFPGVIIGFLISPATGLLAIGIYILVQQLESHVIAPQVMKKAVGLSPITVILVLLIGAKLYGALGAILAIPVATTVSLFVGDLMNHDEK